MDPPGYDRRAIVVHVVPRNLRWEVEVDGLTRRMIDWLSTKERAITHAVERARELIENGRSDHALVVVERSDHQEETRIVVA